MAWAVVQPSRDASAVDCRDDFPLRGVDGRRKVHDVVRERPAPRGQGDGEEVDDVQAERAGVRDGHVVHGAEPVVVVLEQDLPILGESVEVTDTDAARQYESH